MEHLKPESIRYNHDKILYITFEADHDCHLQMAVYQNTLQDLERIKGAKKPVIEKIKNALSKAGSFIGSSTDRNSNN